MQTATNVTQAPADASDMENESGSETQHAQHARHTHQAQPARHEPRAHQTHHARHEPRASHTSHSQDAPHAHHAHANFKRKETKYVLEEGDYLALMALIGDKLEEDEYPYSHIESIYYDTPDWRMINRSMEKPLYKEKLRVRVYGQAHEGCTAFVELKKKFDGIVYKRRIGMSLEGALAFLNGMDFDEAMAAFPPASDQLELEPTWRDRQIAREIRACADRWQPLVPSMIISVDRTSLRASDGSGVRMTFDFDSRWRNTQLSFGEALGSPLMGPGQVILEIKAQGSYPLWLVHALDRAKIYPVSNTKYGRAYRAAFPIQAAKANVRAQGNAHEKGPATVKAAASIACPTTTAPADTAPADPTASVHSPKDATECATAHAGSSTNNPDAPMRAIA